MEGLGGARHRRTINTITHKSSTTNSEQQHTQTSTANTSTSSGEPNRETHSARSCLPHPSLLHNIKEPLSKKVEHTDRPTHHLQRRSPSRTRPQLQMRNHGVRFVEHDPSSNLSNLRFAGDMLLISGSPKHTTTKLDDLTTATTAHGLQLRATKTKIISSATSKNRKTR